MKLKNICLLILAVAASAFGQTTTVTVNTTTKVTQPPVGTFNMDGATGFAIYRGTGSPNTVVSAPPGSLYLDQNGAFWLKTTGTGNSGWTQMPTTSGGTPGGSSKDFQWNNTGAFAGGTGLTYENVAGNTIMLQVNQNADTQFTLKNNNASASAQAAFVADNGTHNGAFSVSGTGASSYGMIGPDQVNLYSTQNINIVADNSGNVIKFAAGAGAIEVARITQVGFQLGNGTGDTALARNAAGVVEINNGTAGQYRDLYVRQATTDRSDAAANTYATGLLLTNNTAATSGNQRYAPSIIMTGQGYKTGGTPGSEANSWRITNVPIQGGIDYTQFNFDYLNTSWSGAYTTKFRIAIDSGNGSGYVQTNDGNVASFPAYSFLSDATMGLYRAGTNDMGLASGGVDRLRINPTGIQIGGSNIDAGSVRLNLVNSTTSGLSVYAPSDPTQWFPVSSGASTSGITTVDGLFLHANNQLGAGGTGIGVGIKFFGETSTTIDTEMGEILGVWTDGTHASRTGRFDFKLVNNAGSDTTALSLRAPGTLAMTTQSAAPGSPVEGWIYANSTDHTLRYYNGSSFISLGGGGTPGGANTNIQYNDSGVFGGDANLTWNKTTFLQTLTGNQNANTHILVQNNNTGSAAQTSFLAQNNFPHSAYFGMNGTNYTAIQDFTGDTTYVYTDATAGIGLFAAAGNVKLAAAGTTAEAMLTGSSFNLGSTIGLGWGSGGVTSTSLDTALARNAAGIMEVNNGTAGQWGALKAGVRDTANAGIPNTLTLGHQLSSGTPTTGMGTAMLFNSNDSTTADVGIAQLQTSWSNATHNSNASDFYIRLTAGSTILSEKLKVYSDGTLVMNGAGPLTGQFMQKTSGSGHGNSAYALPTAIPVSGGSFRSDGTNMVARTVPYGVVTSTVDQTATAETAHVVYTVPANSAAAGTTYRVQAWGNMDNGTTAITFNPRIRWGGTGGTQLIATPTVVGTTTALTNKDWVLVALITIRTIGATGTAFSSVSLSNHTSNTAGTYAADQASSGATGVTIDTTANKDLDLTWTLSATTGTPHVRTLGGYVEIIN